MTLGALFQQSGWQVVPRTIPHDGRRLLNVASTIAHSMLHATGELMSVDVGAPVCMWCVAAPDKLVLLTPERGDPKALPG